MKREYKPSSRAQQMRKQKHNYKYRLRLQKVTYVTVISQEFIQCEGNK